MARLVWEPVFRVGVVFFQFIQPFLSTIYYVVIYVVGSITPLFTSLFRMVGYLLSPIWTVLQRIFLAPFQAFFGRIGKAIFTMLANNYQKILNLTWQAIQPMLNIRGFFARLFGPIITGLKVRTCNATMEYKKAYQKYLFISRPFCTGFYLTMF